MENVTMRNRRPRSSSLIDLSKESIFDTTMMSLPNSSLNESLNPTELYERIKILTAQLDKCNLELQSAHQEIENLLSDNFKLKNDLAKSRATIENYKKISTSNFFTGTPTSGRKKKKSNQNNHSTPSKRLSIVQPEFNQKSYPSTATITTPIIIKPKQRNKVYVLNSRKTKHSLPLIEGAFSDYADFCHFVTPNCSSRELLIDIDKKLKDFTTNDYCILFIGENDIKEDNNYINLIKSIRQSLQSVTHTNIIICAPTYITGAPIYNFKVEMFNNLLHLDSQSNNYAFFFDTNRDLTPDMFSYATGKINRSGMKNIYNRISANIKTDLELYNQADEHDNSFKNSNVSPPHDGGKTSNFFRDQ
ncbi:unnamed protein product [Euphydryas editha]|uniref:Uncharacterized protein n=1 Tax=Euphydryas editha TaxID=104508 RepID=A0AAU9VG54_EUPED|nr:unnamed protein product [Euphydryas editha]